MCLCTAVFNACKIGAISKRPFANARYAGGYRYTRKADATVHTVYPRGIDPSRSYAVTFDNLGAVVEMTGADMMQRGLRVAISGSLSSELIIYEAK